MEVWKGRDISLLLSIQQTAVYGAREGPGIFVREDAVTASSFAKRRSGISLPRHLHTYRGDGPPSGYFESRFRSEKGGCYSQYMIGVRFTYIGIGS